MFTQDFLVFIDYPVLNQKIKGKTLKFDVIGNNQLSCRMLILPKSNKRLPKFIVTVKDQDEVKGMKNKSGNYEYEINGDQTVMVKWS